MNYHGGRASCHVFWTRKNAASTFHRSVSSNTFSQPSMPSLPRLLPRRCRPQHSPLRTTRWQGDSLYPHNLSIRTSHIGAAQQSEDQIWGDIEAASIARHQHPTARESNKRHERVATNVQVDSTARAIDRESQQEPPSTYSLSSVTHAKIHVYNMAASILAIPQFSLHRTSTSETEETTRNRYRSSIRLLALDIEVVGQSDRMDHAEYLAILRFQKAFKHAATQLTNKKSRLQSMHAKPFLEYHASQLLHPPFKIKHSRHHAWLYDQHPGHQAQLTSSSGFIGEQVITSTKASAISLAYLVALVQLANKDPGVLSQFSAYRKTRSQADADADRAQRAKQRVAKKAVIKMQAVVKKAVKNLNDQTTIDLILDTRILESMRSASGSILESSGQTFKEPRLSHSTVKPAVRRPRKSLSDHEIHTLNQILKDRSSAAEKSKKVNLGAMAMIDHQSHVCQLIKHNPYSIIVGATGSGKTTQVPQIILDSAIENGSGAAVNIICVQPRRIAAISIARRVANERGEQLQDSVGYQVKLDSKLPRLGGSITFCTTGILLRQLQQDSDDLFNRVSHIILDEVHERDIYIDVLMATLKHLLEERKRSKNEVPKVVLMSATMDTNSFAAYFADHAKRPCPSVQVPGRTYPVVNYHLEDIMPLLQSHGASYLDLTMGETSTAEYLANEMALGESTPGPSDRQALESLTSAQHPPTPTGLVAMTIAHIAKCKPEGAILVFLPGLKDILKVETFLHKCHPLGMNFRNTDHFQIFKLHSFLRDDATYRKVFETVPNGCRKIVLSTNIAETSITIPDVRYVVDTGKVNEHAYNQETRASHLQSTWISKSSSKQRAGRGGRVRSGEYYTLFTKSRLNSFATTHEPEILRSDLQDVSLNIKAALPRIRIQDLLASTIEPPSPKAVTASIQRLKDLGALSLEEQITPLGSFLAKLPFHPSMGKLVILGIIFRCLDTMLIISAAAGQNLFLRPPGLEWQADAARRAFGSEHQADCIGVVEAFRSARKIYTESKSGRNIDFDHIREEYMNPRIFKDILDTMHGIEESLVSHKIIPVYRKRHGSMQCGPPSLNDNSDNYELIKALTCVNSRGNIALPDRKRYTLLRTMENKRVLIHPSSTNAPDSRPKFARQPQEEALPRDALLTFTELLKGKQDTMLLDTTRVTPLMVSLFGSEPKWPSSDTVTIENWLRFKLALPLPADYTDTSEFDIPQESRFTAVKPSSVEMRPLDTTEARETLQEFRRALDSVLEAAISDLAHQKPLDGDEKRVAFTSALAKILQDDAKARKERNLWNTKDAAVPFRRPSLQERIDVNDGARPNESLAERKAELEHPEDDQMGPWLGEWGRLSVVLDNAVRKDAFPMDEPSRIRELRWRQRQRMPVGEGEGGGDDGFGIEGHEGGRWV